jgi:hypothetical protein
VRFAADVPHVEDVPPRSEWLVELECKVRERELARRLWRVVCYTVRCEDADVVHHAEGNHSRA